MLETKFECVEDVMKLEISFGLFLGDPSQTHLLSVEQLSKTSSHTFSQIDSEWTLDYSKTQLFKDFVLTGIKHILNGLDHLLFILTLVFAAHSLRKLFWIITSFTLAHSFSLLWATFNWINLSPNIVEPLVALSIMVMACLSLLRTRTGQEPFEMSKNCRAEEVNTSITTNSPFRQDFHSLRRVVFAHVKRFLSYFRAKPETITFFFGIIHGLAFSEVLKETHLQGLNLIIPLLGFNSGVELAQLMIVIPFFIILSALTRHQIRLYRFVKTTLLLFCLLAAAYWFYSRIIHS